MVVTHHSRVPFLAVITVVAGATLATFGGVAKSPLPLAAAGACGLVALTLAPRAGLYALLALLPFHSVIKYYAWSPLVGTYWKEALIAGLMVAFVIRLLLRYPRRSVFSRIRRSRLLIPLGLYFGVIVIRFVVGPDYGLGLWGLYFYGTYFSVFLLAVLLFDGRDVNTIFSLLAVLGGVIGALVLADALLDLSGFQVRSDAEWFMADFGFRRARFPFASPLAATAFLATTAAVSYQAMVKPIFWRHSRWVLLLLFLANLAGLLATFSRGGWVCLGISVLAISLLQSYPTLRLPGARTVALVVLVSALGAGVASYYGLTSLLFERITSVLDLRELGNFQRLLSWQHSFQEYSTAPVAGIGVGQTGARVLEFSSSAFVTESYVLQHLVEMGVVGLVAYLVLVVGVLRLGLRVLRVLPESRARAGAVAATAALFSLFVYSSYLQVLQMREIAALFWLLVGLLVVLADEGTREQVSA